ncbi:MFS transporter [Jiella mangrovi]|uniref:MFS transporter n=1 Tax=Jiella mangrovi TaxID=2821407 RepID=UPI0031581E5C
MTTDPSAHEPGLLSWPIATLALSTLLASLGISIANVALPAIAQAFLRPFSEVQWVVLAYLLATTVTIAGAGKAADVFGPRRVLFAGILLFAASSLAGSIAPTLPWLLAARTGQGIGAAILTVAALSLLREIVLDERIGRAMGLFGTMSAVGTALGPSLGGVLVSGPGWRACFVLLAALGALNAALALRVLPPRAETPKPRKRQFDMAGALLLAATLTAYCLAIASRSNAGVGEIRAAFLAAAIVGLILFVRLEWQAPAPLIDIAALRRPATAGGLAANLLVSGVMMATLVVGPFYLAFGLGLHPVAVGLVMAVGPITSALTGLIAGWATDRLGATKARLAGLAVMIPGAAGLALLPAVLGIAGYVLALLVLTPGYQLFLAANSTAVMAEAARTDRGVASGLIGLSRNLGLITGTTVLGAVFAASIGASAVGPGSPQAIGHGLMVSFLVAAGGLTAAFAIVMACARREETVDV